MESLTETHSPPLLLLLQHGTKSTLGAHTFCARLATSASSSSPLSLQPFNRWYVTTPSLLHPQEGTTEQTANPTETGPKRFELNDSRCWPAAVADAVSLLLRLLLTGCLICLSVHPSVRTNLHKMKKTNER